MKGVTAFYAGSFDPPTKGHENIALRAAKMFDKLIVALGVNSEKQQFFPPEQRLKWLNDIFKDIPNIEVEAYEGLTVNACRRSGASVLVRGVRSISDYEQEQNTAAVNKILDPDIESVFLFADEEYSHYSSTNAREILKYNGTVKKIIPEQVKIKEK